MRRFIRFSREQQYFLPPSMNDWLQENHLARFIAEVVDQLELSKLIRRFSGCGSAAYHPALMLALLVYGYATGVFSSRKIERATYDSVAFRFIAAEQHPDHDTLANFRKTFLMELEDLFVQVLTLLHTMKLVKPGQIALDGTKIKANASKHKEVLWGRTRLSCFRSLPTPFEVARRRPRASIFSLNFSRPSAQPLCVQSRISARSFAELAPMNTSQRWLN